MKKANLIIGISVGMVFLGLASALVVADRLESDSYVVSFGNFNVTSGEKSSASYNVTDTVGGVGTGPYGSTVGSGFQYIYAINNFSFNISSVAVNLGELTPGDHKTANHTLTINTKGAGGYLVYAYEKHPLKSVDGPDTIPNTTCNSGTCTITTAGIWNNTSIAGFGFNMSGHDIPADFIDATYFRPFADESAAQAMQVVMSSNNIAENRTATVTYKAGAGGDQTAGAYETYVMYVAVPGY